MTPDPHPTLLERADELDVAAKFAYGRGTMFLPNTAQTKPTHSESKPPLLKRVGWLLVDMLAAVVIGVAVGWLLWLWNPLGEDDDV